MPRFDGMGPQGEGPLSGRGEGYCAVRLPQPGQAVQGYIGLQGTPIARWLRSAVRCGRGFGRDRGRGGRGRRFVRR